MENHIGWPPATVLADESVAIEHAEPEPCRDGLLVGEARAGHLVIQSDNGGSPGDRRSERTRKSSGGAAIRPGDPILCDGHNALPTFAWSDYRAVGAPVKENQMTPIVKIRPAAGLDDAEDQFRAAGRGDGDVATGEVIGLSICLHGSCSAVYF